MRIVFVDIIGEIHCVVFFIGQGHIKVFGLYDVSQFIVDIGEEAFKIGAVDGHVRNLVVQSLRFFSSYPLGDVMENTAEFDFILGIYRAVYTTGKVYSPVVFSDKNGIEFIDLFSFENQLKCNSCFLSVIFMNDIKKIDLVNLFVNIPQGFFPCLVYKKDLSVLFEDHDKVIGVVKELLKLVVGPLKLIFNLFLFGYIFPDDGDVFNNTLGVVKDDVVELEFDQESLAVF